MSTNGSVGGTFYEFFAGGGMARAGLGDSWVCLFANDVDEKKAGAYALNWGDKALRTIDVAGLTSADLPGTADLAWASFPCQDLSLAGNGAGLKGARSGTFWPFWRLIESLGRDGRSPTLVVLENVYGALKSHSGRDFSALAGALAEEGYRFGALVIDAVHFVPQSRPRLFIVAVRQTARIPTRLTREAPAFQWSPPALIDAHKRLTSDQEPLWIWWNLPAPPHRATVLSDLVEDEPSGVRWHTEAETTRFLDLMSPLNRKKVQIAQRMGRRVVGTIYRRTRPDGEGSRVQRAEVRFDDIAGCLRTPVGGSSRQVVIVVEGSNIRSRLLSPREAARLMGLPEDYKLPDNYNEAYHLSGDGLVVPVVRHLAEHILEPVIESARSKTKEAA